MRDGGGRGGDERVAGSRAGQPAGPSAAPPGPVCPFCGSDRVELLSLFGSASLTSQYRCARCRSAFEYVKWGTAPPDPGSRPWP